MTLIRRPSLFPELEPLRDVADRLFDERSWWPLWAVERGREMVPPLDLYSTPEAIIAKVALAGVKPEDVDVKITDEFVTIEGKFEEEKETTDAGAVQREIGHGLLPAASSFRHRSRRGEAKAVFQDGLLTLTLPKKQRELPAKHVKVEVESAAEAADLGAMGGPVVPRGLPALLALAAAPFR